MSKIDFLTLQKFAWSMENASFFENAFKRTFFKN